MQGRTSGGSVAKRPDEPQLPQLTATLLPHRSLSRKGFIALMLVGGAINSVLSVAFALRGARPVAGFCPIAVGLLYLAFRLNHRAARMSETIVLSEPELLLTRQHPTGWTESWSFNPYWVRFQHVRRDNTTGELSIERHASIWTLMSRSRIDQLIRLQSIPIKGGLISEAASSFSAPFSRTSRGIASRPR